MGFLKWFSGWRKISSQYYRNPFWNRQGDKYKKFLVVRDFDAKQRELIKLWGGENNVVINITREEDFDFVIGWQVTIFGNIKYKEAK